MDEHKISIIVPVYNVEKYLSKCLDSLIGQTYKNIEIICVNDGSPDSCDEILDNYSKNDNRIRIITKKNEGLSAARNDALKICTGQYVMFVDSDDWIDTDMCEVMYKTVVENQADVCMCCYTKEFGNNSSVESIFGHDIVLEGEEFREKFYRRLFGLCGEELRNPEKCDSIVSAWMQLFKREIVSDVEFIDTKIIGTEDLMFQIIAYRNCKKFVYIDKPMYHYLKINQSSLTSLYKPNLYWQREKMFDLIDKVIYEDKLPETYKNALSNRIALNIIGMGLNERYSDKNILKKAEAMKNILKSKRYKEAFRRLDYSYFPVVWRIFFLMCRMRLALPLTIMFYIIEFLRKR